MASLSLTKHVPAPPETVFDYATDLRRADERISAIVKLEVLTDGPVGAGTRFRETRVVMKREATEEMEVTSFERPRTYAVGCESHGCRFRSAFTFAPAAGGGTDVAVTFEAEPLTLGAKVMSVVMRPMLKSCVKEMGKDLDDIARAIEAEGGSASTAGADAQQASRP